MKLDIKKNLMSQMIHFQFKLDPGHRGLEGGNINLGNRKFWKTLRVEKS